MPPGASLMSLLLGLTADVDAGAGADGDGDGDGHDSHSLSLLSQTHALCTEAIDDFLHDQHLDAVAWTAQRGLAADPHQLLSQLPGLLRSKHSRFLLRLIGRLPGGFAKLDASRPWMLYWAINGLRTLNLDFEQTPGLLATLVPIQNADGGFGGSHGQCSHLATTYAAVLALVASGAPPSALHFIDRRELHDWLGRLKQANGAFAMAEGGETDVRAVYIVLVLLRLFNLPAELPRSSAAARAAGHSSFTQGVGEYIRACQAYDGGIGCNPSTEAHGAYTFCALAALCLLEHGRDPGPGPAMHTYLDLDALVQWVAWRQEDITGGLAGRTNKLVDNCYSHWIGGCWPLLENAVAGSPEIFNRVALSLYILACGQAPYGGLRDKPGMDADAYHSCYGLAGLSMAMHRWRFERGRWTLAAASDARASRPDDRQQPSNLPEFTPLAPLHPVFMVPIEEAVAVQEYFQARPLARDQD